VANGERIASKSPQGLRQRIHMFIIYDILHTDNDLCVIPNKDRAPPFLTIYFYYSGIFITYSIHKPSVHIVQNMVHYARTKFFLVCNIKHYFRDFSMYLILNKMRMCCIYEKIINMKLSATSPLTHTLPMPQSINHG
jgi:hypothetical protein